MSEHLVIAAKAPRAGVAKTRLARAIGDGPALALYRAFLCDLAERLAPQPRPVWWYVTPPDAWIDLAPLVDARIASAGVVPQPKGDWTERQRALFRAMATDAGRVVLIASDSPQIAAQDIDAAFAALDGHDLVLGPTTDRGYWLLGMRGHIDVLDGVEMSAGDVSGAIRARARALGASLALLPETFDVDEHADLDVLARRAEAGDLPWCATALARLGSLRTAP